MEALCVYVPTFHRHLILKKCLRSVIAECKRSGHPIKIYVSNNDKNDFDTRQTVMEMQEEYPIIYSENDTDLGIDGNMRKGFEIQGTHYCLMLGDDDELCEGALDVIKDVCLHEREFAFAILNWAYVSPAHTAANLWGEENVVYTDAVECFKCNYGKMPYGTILCNLKYASMVSKEEKDRFMGTYHLYSGILWDMALRCSRVIRIAKPAVVKPKYEKTYSGYLADVLLRGIVEWYDKLAEEYQEWAQPAKMLWIMKCLRDADEVVQKELLEQFSHSVEGNNEVLYCMFRKLCDWWNRTMQEDDGYV